MIQGNPESAPNLRTVQELRDYAHLFTLHDSNGKAVLWSCPANSECAKINEKQVRAYGLDDVIELREPRNYDALFDNFLRANEARNPWLGFMWGPTRVIENLDLKLLEEPLCSVGQKPADGCGYDLSKVRIAVHPDLVSDAPDIVELLRKWDFNKSTQFAAEECLEETSQDYDAAAICYLKNEEAVWAQWMPTEVAQKVRQALTDS